MHQWIDPSQESPCRPVWCRVRSAVQRRRLRAPFLQALVEDGDPTLMFVLQTRY